MHPSIPLAPTLLGLAAASLQFTTPSFDGSFTIPPGTADGVYAVQTHDNGTAHHVRLDPARPGTLTSLDGKPMTVSPRTAPPPRLAKRQWRYGWRVFCPARPQRVDAGETDAAVADVKRQCGAKLDVPSGWHIYAVRGSVAAFYCNFVSDATSCSSDEFGTRAAEISGACGAYIAGWNDQVRLVPLIDLYVPSYFSRRASLTFWSFVIQQIARYGNPVVSEYHVGSYGYHNIGGDKSFCGRNHG